MSRPCQKRRATAAANRASKPKPAGPPPIRHKARQKAIHNARRGGGRGGRSQNSGGRPSRNQQSGDDTQQDFISFASSGNNFHALHRGSRQDPIELDDTDDAREDGELTASASDSDDFDDADLHDADDMMINVQMEQPAVRRARVVRAEVMYTIPEAIAVYRRLLVARFPLSTGSRTRYRLYQVDTSPDSGASTSRAPSALSRAFRPSSATSEEPMATREAHRPAPAARNPEPEAYNPARDYVFNWGAHSGQRFDAVPENYLRTIGGQLYKYMHKRAGLLEAFEYHRPGQARTADPGYSQAPPLPPSAPSQAPLGPRGHMRSSARSASETYNFHKGQHAGKRLHEVPESYIRTLEGQSSIVNSWPGFKRALQDFNAKMGRQGRA
ncbi:hypothetical protein EJ02DRAFT_333639 [Clathrospora elynae]|uniref:Uncharacterized protein n=1 Tax=Clathrospora elynae TaxID=706981 RepID=A0A6A5S7K7_9PLEO|nr:hypothetical protein EJ02DRAFT_358763 [Clathrospora elynae]KAF1947368.1 hypothetical protein EJ02DRAFT_333639 [Clathrospora elynae]